MASPARRLRRVLAAGALCAACLLAIANIAVLPLDPGGGGARGLLEINTSIQTEFTRLNPNPKP